MIIVIIAALVTYFLAFRNRKQDKFNIQMEKGLEEILSTMLHEIRIIRREENALNRQKLLRELFFKYNREDTKLFKMLSKSIHDFYYTTEELYLNFEKSKKKDE